MQSGWCPAVYLDVVFSSWVPHEHCVEGGYLVDAHPGHTDHLGHMVHGRDRKPTVLTLKVRVVGSDQLFQLVQTTTTSRKQNGTGPLVYEIA